jgi:hypothetical protein
MSLIQSRQPRFHKTSLKNTYNLLDIHSTAIYPVMDYHGYNPVFEKNTRTPQIYTQSISFPKLALPVFGVYNELRQP